MTTKIAVIILTVAAISVAVLFSFQTITGNNQETSSNIPLPNIHLRPQLLTFGTYVTPDSAQNPIDPPERFTGYHTALDIEILDGEENTEVPVQAVCDGKILQSGSVEGYGGLIVQQCTLSDQEVTVIYGHLDIASLAFQDMYVVKGQVIAKLAPEKSIDSGHTRKHLHLGIHKGTEIDVRGYVDFEEELQEFLDPKVVLGI